MYTKEVAGVLLTFDNLNRNNKTYVITGDINIDLLDNKPNISNFKNQIKSHGCIQTVSTPTRISSKNKNSLLDHVKNYSKAGRTTCKFWSK